MLDKKTRLPDGLPARFQADKNETDGLKKLYSFLGIENRQQRQAILKSNPVKQAVGHRKGISRLRTTERERVLITAFYERPRERRELWKVTINHGNELLVPSLELRAAQKYDPDFRELEAPDPPEEIFGANTETPEEWQRPALALWPQLRRDLREWKTLTDDRRDDVTLALFAVATVLDNVQLLQWASEQVPDLSDEFAFCLDEQAAARAVDQLLVENTDNAMSRWSAACDAVAGRASILREKPWDTDCFDELRQQVKVLDELQALAVAEAPAVRIDQVRKIVSDLAAEFEDLPIASHVDDIVAQWRAAHRVNDAVDAVALKEDVDRLDRELPEAVLDWQRALEHAVALQHKLEEVEREARTAPDPASRFKAEDRKAELHEQIADAGKTKTAAGRHILQVAAPSGHEFDPTAGDEQAPSEDHAVTTTGRDDDTQTHEPSEVDAAEQLSRDKAPESNDASSDGEPARTEQPQNPWEPAADERPSRAASADGLVSVATAALWQTFRQGRQGIAYHIARLLAEQGISEPAFPPANLIAASMLANHVQSSDSRVVGALREIVVGLDPNKLAHDSWSDEEKIIVNLMLFNAALRPALFAPAAGAIALLRQIRVSTKDLASVYNLAKVVADHADRLRGVRLDASLVMLGDRWPEEFSSFVSRVHEWHKQAPSKRNLFGRADRVWHDLLNGPLSELVTLIERDDETGKDKVESIRHEMANRRGFETLVKKTDRKNRKGNPIEGRALKQLWNDVQHAVKFANEWFRLLDAKPKRTGFADRRTDVLQRDVNKYGKEAITAIDRVLKTDSASSALAATLNQTRTTVEQLLQVFDDSNPVQESVDESAEILSRDLLYVTNLDITPKFAPKAHLEASSVLDLLIDTAAHANTARAAFDERLERQDFVGARLACDRIEAQDNVAVDECREILGRRIRERQKELRKMLAAEEARMESAFCRGQIDADQREDMAVSLASLRTLEQSPISRPLSLDEVAEVDSGVRKVKEIDYEIESSLGKRVDEVRKRLDALPSGRLNKETKSTIVRTINDGHILTASEQISRLENGEPIAPPPTEDDPFGEFMSSVNNIERSRREFDASPLAIVRRARARTPVAGISFDKLTVDKAHQAADLLDAWYKLAKKQRVDNSLLQNLLQRLGFMVLGITSDPRRRGWPRVDVQTEVIEDRDLCPSRQFGSQSKGRYRMLLNWEQPADESIAKSMGNDGGNPTVVLHFGCLGDDRDKLRRRAIQSHRLFLVIDEALALFLAGRPSRRLSAMFRCSLPFTSVEPYATTSGLVPPELFYGREYERQSVMEQSGTCFIYGGRQLGKTALLRRVERDFTLSRDTHFAHWIDLKANEIGYGRGPHDIWLVLQRELRRLDTVGKFRDRELDPKVRRQVESFVESIRHWLDERADRRLILLLDEADEFLVKDAETDFLESTRLKKLMDDTDRRFKVVFAGLHNVLRTTRQANHPLAHFGDPICIGAMLSNGEWRQAQALVREPLHAVGCRFGHDDLSTRILALTNYYPSLIQLYGAELLRRLRDSSQKFPYEIGDDDIDDAYASSELRSAIRERFLLTLQLDQRYEVIAYALVHKLYETALNEGLTSKGIAEEVKYWWPEGFDIQDVEFSMLLQEMEGLGVLRSVGDRYTFRNPNILLLLGKRDDVEYALVQAKWNLPTTYEPKSYRGRYPKDKASSRRGPLTYLQESDLRTGGVTVITGCNAAGLENAEDFLSQRMEHVLQKLPPAADASEFERRLKEQRPVRNRVTVYLVPLEVSWDASWLQSAKRILKRRAQGRTMWMRVAFIAPPSQLWRLMSDAGDQNASDVQWIDVGPWDRTFLRKWLEDINDSATEEHTRDLWEASGGWTEVLDWFSRVGRNKSWRTRIDNLKRETRKNAGRLMSEQFDMSNDTRQMLRKLLDIAGDEPFEPDDGAPLVSEDIGVDRSEVLRRLDWSSRLGLLTRVGEGRLTFNPLVRRLIEATDIG